MWLYLSTSARFALGHLDAALTKLNSLLFQSHCDLHSHTKGVVEILCQYLRWPLAESHSITRSFKPLRFAAVKYFKSSFGHAGVGLEVGSFLILFATVLLTALNKRMKALTFAANYSGQDIWEFHNTGLLLKLLLLSQCLKWPSELKELRIMVWLNDAMWWINLIVWETFLMILYEFISIFDMASYLRYQCCMFLTGQLG